jgi:hypothetical protein
MIVAVIIAVVIVVSFTISVFVRRHGESDRPQANWRRTEEAFHDPSTGRIMRVWLDERGERHYVHESNAPST